MSNEAFLSTHLLKKSMEEKLLLSLEFEDKIKQNIDYQTRIKRNACGNRTEYVTIIKEEIRGLKVSSIGQTQKEFLL